MRMTIKVKEIELSSTRLISFPVGGQKFVVDLKDQAHRNKVVLLTLPYNSGE
jgi:hypothetical protein